MSGSNETMCQIWSNGVLLEEKLSVSVFIHFKDSVLFTELEGTYVFVKHYVPNNMLSTKEYTCHWSLHNDENVLDNLFTFVP